MTRGSRAAEGFISAPCPPFPLRSRVINGDVPDRARTQRRKHFSLCFAQAVDEIMFASFGRSCLCRAHCHSALWSRRRRRRRCSLLRGIHSTESNLFFLYLSHVLESFRSLFAAVDSDIFLHHLDSPLASLHSRRGERRERRYWNTSRFLLCRLPSLSRSGPAPCGVMLTLRRVS